MKTHILFLVVCLFSNFIYAQNFGFQLDGTGGGASVCDSDDYDIGNGFTIEAWIFASEWRAEEWQGSIVTKDGQNPDAGFAFRAGQDGILSMVMSVNASWFEVQSDPIMNENQWYHVAARVDNGTLTLFINGQPVNSGTFSGTPTSNDRLLSIGFSPGFPGRIWNGTIDEVRIWNVARTNAEINDNQTVELTGNEPGLVSYFPMNAGSGNSLSNAVGASCDATINGGGWSDGWSIPAIDLGIVGVVAPDVLSIYRRPVRATVEIQNYGSEPVTSIPVTLSVNGIPTLSETYNGNLMPGEVTEYTFEQPLDLRANNTNLLGASTAHADDANGLNDAANYRYRRPEDDRFLSLLRERQHNFGSAGQTQFQSFNMPRNMEDFEQILLHFSVECPNTGCDPWDQPASFFIVSEEGEEIEIARFITPFGIECNNWTINVTDFKTAMAGNVTLKSFVQVWGPSGWLVNAELEFLDADAPIYQDIHPLWQEFNWVYGDPGINYDLPEQTVQTAAHSENAYMRLTLSGHGQGNTDNAAEFANKTHAIYVNSDWVDDHNPWKTDCGQNSCNNQNGTWTLSRAGWCPGQEVLPYFYDFGSDWSAGQSLAIDYELQEYTNFLNTDYNDGSHTEPHFRIASFVIEQSDQHYQSLQNLRADSLVVFVEGDPGQPQGAFLDMIFTNTGSEAMINPIVTYYIEGVEIFQETIDATIEAGDTYYHRFSQNTGLTGEDDQDIFAQVAATGDENTSDNLTADVELVIGVSTQDALAAGIDIFPNPAPGRIYLRGLNDLLGGQLTVFDAQGRLLQSIKIGNTQMNVELKGSGLRMLLFQSTDGQRYSGRIVLE
ncbi:MAG: LamG-like jellyroll fold domain-containing protein [Bacteroidota bacterium]